MKTIYQAGYKLCIYYFNGLLEIAETPKAAKNMLKCIKRSNFFDVDTIKLIKGNKNAL